jgi:hypothetical protein
MAVLIAAFLSSAPFAALAVAGLAPAVSGSPRAGQNQYRQLVPGSRAVPRSGDHQPWWESKGVMSHWWPMQGAAPAGGVITSHGRPASAAVTLHGHSSGQRPEARQPRMLDLVSAILLSVLAVLVLATLALGAGLAAHLVLVRRRLAAWECDWACIEPRWTQRRR